MTQFHSATGIINAVRMYNTSNLDIKHSTINITVLQY